MGDGRTPVTRRISEIGGQLREPDRLSIGRGPENDLVIVEPSVSRHHAALVRSDGRSWRLVDLGSHNGTFLNGSRVDEEEAVPLGAGDEIRLGEVLVLFDRPPERRGVDGSTVSLAPDAVGRHRTLVGRSPAMRELLGRIDKVARSPLTVLITGESGTGKELVAELIHASSPRRKGPFVVVNCPALPESLFEAELFGVESRVATGVDPRLGKLESADGGTLFLDEIGEMELPAQAKLLRFLQDKKLERVGSRQPVELDVRIVAATNAELEIAVDEGRFRLDLFNRLGTLELRLPPLRERREDIPLLVEHFLALHGRGDLSLTEGALELLMSHDYPGNVRQLERFVLSAATFAEGPAIEAVDLPEELRSPGRTAASSGDELLALQDELTAGRRDFWTDVREPFLRRELSREEVRLLIARCRRNTDGSLRGLARLLGIEEQREYKRLTNFLRNHDLVVEE